MDVKKVYRRRSDAAPENALERTVRDDRALSKGPFEKIERSWRARHSDARQDDEWQERVRAEAMRCAGSIKGGDPDLAANASERVGEILRRKHGR